MYIENLIAAIVLQYENQSYGDAIDYDSIDDIKKELKEFFDNRKALYDTKVELMYEAPNYDIYSFTISWLWSDEINSDTYRVIKYK